MRHSHPKDQYGPSAGRRLASLSTIALSVAAAIVLVGASPSQQRNVPRRGLVAPADTDSVVVNGIRVAVTDTVVVDSAAADTNRASRYIPLFRRPNRTAAVADRSIAPLVGKLPQRWKTEVEFDSSSGGYVARERIGDLDVRDPISLDRHSYRSMVLRRNLDENWAELVAQSEQRRRQSRRGGLGFNIVVPGGRQSAFTTIFGKPDVSLRVNGNADIRAGFNYQQSEQQSIFGQKARIDPEFKQDLQLGINGSIGDKMQINVNYDTQNKFDFENKLELKYTGYEDEIIQSIEAGNVLLNTPSKLIRGGQSLFGIKSEFQIGGVHLTTVMSQQEGQASNKQISGGTEATPFEIRPIEYDDGRHYFLGYYFRNRWEDALSDPGRIILANGFERIDNIELWRFDSGYRVEEEDVREVVAMVDVGESSDILDLANTFTSAGPADLPGPALDQYTEEDLAILRDRNQSADNFLGSSGKGLSERSDFQTGPFKRLEKNIDYTVDEQLGYITLNARLNEDQAIAVAYRYFVNGAPRQVGDFSTDTGGADENTRLVLKLLRPRSPEQPGPTSNPAAWYLEMRNIYRLGASQLNSTGFELNIEYARPGQAAQTKIPALSGNRTLLDLLGLDRLTQDGAPGSDEIFDYVNGITIVPSKGLLIFPYLEPFGSRISEIATANSTDPSDYAFLELYRQKKQNAQTITKYNLYRITGEYKGSVASTYDLNSFAGIVPGSIRVTSAGAELTENVDYIVDYTGGSVTITNDAYLIEGRNIDISFEENSFAQIQKKSLLGLRADYDLDERLSLGATGMRLSEKSPTDKFRIGEEPISNFIWGVDGSFDSDVDWLTRAIDKVPLLQTRQASRITLSGEFAQLRPGHTQTQAFSRSRRDLRKDGRDFNRDELNGISYLDDFEGFETTLPLTQPGSWRISSAPDSIGIVDNADPAADSLRTNWRASGAWYRINNNTLSEIDALAYNVDAVRTIEINEVYPDRELNGQTDRTLSTFDFYINPHERGPYNYTTDLNSFINSPRDTWAGMIQRIPDGYTDFSTKNIEFVEFIFQPFAENPANMADADAKLYLDLGFISEDVLPDERLNDEDGLSTTTIDESAINAWGRRPTTIPDKVVKLDETNQRTEDLGIDGLASYGGNYPEIGTETFHFRHFLDAIDPANNNPYYRAERARSILDPSADDFHYFGDDNYFKNEDIYPGGATVQQRFSRFFSGLELNGFESQRELADRVDVADRRGNSRYPDSEDLNGNSAPDLLDSYYQYAIPLNKDELDRLAVPSEVDDYIVTEITSQSGERTGWYQVRIPVRDFTRKVGEIQDFTQIETVRMWMTGLSDPLTVRFASLELVGSQWRKGASIPLYDEDPNRTVVGNEPAISISSVNNEENSSVYLPPRGTVIAETRLANGQRQASREQAMVLRVENVDPGQQLAIYKPFTQGIDLLKYSNLRMFVHAHGLLGDGTAMETLPTDLARSKARLFVRLGANETGDYYEYEQPLTPSSEVSGNSDDLWQTAQLFNGETIDLNSVNIEMSAFNQLKVERDQRNAPTDSVFWNVLDGQVRGPDATDFAPPGTRLGIKGTPSLGRINSIVIGIRNPSTDTLGVDPANVLEDVTVWINEMRVSGYDESNGWSAVAAANVKLADLGTVDARFSTQTDGFGGLSSTLDDREQNNLQSWSVTSTLNVDQPIPERFGWSIPVTLQTSSNTSEPRFSPSTGDIRIDDIIQQIETRDDLTPEERKARQSYVREASSTKRLSKSVSVRVGKSGSKSKLLRNTVDGLAASYSYSVSEASNPSQTMQDDWKWSGSLGYRFNSRKPRTIKIFGPLEGIPVIGVLGKLRFNYLPSSISLNASANRSYGVSQDRTPSITFEQNDSILNFLDNPLRQRHTFSLSRTTAWQYNPFQFLNLGLDTNTGQSMNALGVRTVWYQYGLDDETRTEVPESAVLPDSVAAANGLAFQDEIVVRPAARVLGDAINGSDLFRTNQHTQRFNATLRTSFNKSKALNWIDLQDVAYTAQFNWQNGAEGRNDGASLGNQYDIRTGLSLKIQELFRKFEFYKNLEQAEKDAERERENERRERDAARKKAKEDRAKRREAEKLEMEAARQRADSLGIKLKDLLKMEADSLAAQEAAARAQAVLDSVAAANAAPDSLVSPDSAAVIDSPALADSTLADSVKSPRLAEGIARRARPKGAAKPADEATTEAETESRGGFRIPLPDPVSILRRTVLAITGIRDLNVTYSGSHSSRSSNVGTQLNDGTVETPYSLFDRILNGRGPSLGYRFGFNRTVDSNDRVFSEGLQVSDALTDAHRFQGRTSLNPSRSLTINLSWQADYSETQTATLRNESGTTLRTETLSGTNKSSVWVFKPNYVDLVQRQLDTYNSDLSRSNDPTTVGDADGDGRVVLTNRSVAQDFRQVFGNSSITVDGRNLMPLPLPNWTINYTGLGKWPLLRRLVQSATIRHNYSSDYGSDFRTNSLALTENADSSSFSLGSQTIVFNLPDIETGAIRVNRRYTPLIGFDFTFKNRLQANIGFNRSNSYSLSTSNFDINESSTSELTASITYQKTGLKLPFFKGKKLNNRVSFSLSFARSTTDDKRYLLRKALVEAVSDPAFKASDALTGDLVSEITSNIRTTISPQISYTFSNRVSANFVLSVVDFQGDTRQPSSRNINGTFNFRVNISDR